MPSIPCSRWVRSTRRIKSRANPCVNSGVPAAIPAPQRAPGWEPVHQFPPSSKEGGN
jgi:hypothetical protein